MEFFRNTNIDFLGKKWYFLTFSLIFSVAGLLSMAFWHGIPLGVDFRGGTLVYVKYAAYPDPSAIHNEIERAGLKNARVQRYGAPGNNEVLIGLDIQETSEQDLSNGKDQIKQALEATRWRASRISTTPAHWPLKIIYWRRIRCSSVPALRPTRATRHRAGHCRLSRQDERRRAGVDRGTEDGGRSRRGYLAVG